MTERICPACGRGILTRCGRQGLWEKHVLSLFGVYPWRCGRCRTRLRLSDRGADFKRLPVKPDGFDARVAESATEVHGAERSTGGLTHAEASTDTGAER